MFFSRIFDHFFNRKFRNNRAAVRGMAPEFRTWAANLAAADCWLRRLDRIVDGRVETTFTARSGAPFPGMPPGYRLSGFVVVADKVTTINLFDNDEVIELELFFLPHSPTLSIEARCPVVRSWWYWIHASGALEGRVITVDSISLIPLADRDGTSEITRNGIAEIRFETGGELQSLDLEPWIRIAYDTRRRLEYLLARPSKGGAR